MIRFRGRRRVGPASRVTARGAAACLGLLLASGFGGTLGPSASPALEAQSLRISGTTVARYVEVRPFEPDSVPAEELEGSGLLRQAADGRVMRCEGDEFCWGMQPGPTVSSIPATQDLEVSAWGFGEGVRLFAQFRGRTGWGGNPDLWPRADDAFDVLAAYGEVDRGRFRVRLGRQWQTSGLGFYNFDGAAVRVRPFTGVQVEGYAGRSLVRGLNEPRTGEALEAVEELAPREPGVLLGFKGRYRPTSRLTVSALYHRDMRRDRGGLYSELARADAVYRFDGGSLEGSVEADVATRRLNEARIRFRSPPIGGFAFRSHVRRYRPYFELWTIWGAFSPVGFDEGRLEVVLPWREGRVIARGHGTYRSYEDTGRGGAGLGDFRSGAWGLGAEAEWRPVNRWRFEGGYRFEVGFGATRSEGRMAAVRSLGDRGSLSLHGLAFQRLYEFRLDEGSVVGLGTRAILRLSDRARLVGGISAYRHLDAGDAPGMDWTQVRGNLQLRWTVGSEPEVPDDAPPLPPPDGGAPGGDR